jgi:mitochondrial-processing peptidase subunit beta
VRDVQSEQAARGTLLDHLHVTAFQFQGTGLERNILGSEENIWSLNPADLVDDIKTHYTATQMVIAGAGK